jgi:ankyrin repeat protein
MQEEEAFLEASENGDLNALKLLFSKFNNSLYLLTIKDRFGNNAFLNACSYGNMDCAIWLFDKGSSLSLTNNIGTS